MNICKSIEYYADHYPNQEALVFEGEYISYSILNKQINRAANGLKSVGVNKNDSVAIMLPNIPEFIYLFYACQKIGAIAVTVNTMYKGNEVKHILKDSNAKVIICLTNFIPSINEIRSDLPCLKHVITFGERTISFADPEGTLFIQQILNKKEKYDIDLLYRKIGSVLVESMKFIGVEDVWYSHRGGLRLKDGRKIGGVMIYEVDDILIVNSVIFMAPVNFNDMLSVLLISQEVRGKVIEPIASVKELLGDDFIYEKLIGVIIEKIQSKFDVSLINGKLTREERFSYEKQLSLVRKKRYKRISLWQKVKCCFLKKEDHYDKNIRKTMV